MYSIIVKKSAQKKLALIPYIYQRKIVEAINALSNNPRPDGVKKLTNTDGYRIRIGDYRIVYTIEDSRLIIEIIRVGHRKDIYR